jgi:DNA primase
LFGRPVSLVRAPDGVGKQTFFQKHAMKGMPKEIKLIDIAESDGKPEEYITLPDATAIVSAAQISALEFHLWGSKNKDLEHPDRLIFDLDPDEDLDFPDRETRRVRHQSAARKRRSEIVRDDHRRQRHSHCSQCEAKA